MSGVTNTGLVSTISNPVNSFPANSITIDIFGNVFYRGYSYSASDDVGVYWSDDNISREALLYIVVAIAKALRGKYNYGNKLRASQSLKLKISLPVANNDEPDYNYMETYIKIQQKLVIQNVIYWQNRKANVERRLCETP